MSSRKSARVKIALIGGGTGSFTLLGALKTRTSHLTALVTMADDGGSTGQLRDELGVLPPGDVRQCLVALSDTPELRDLFSYRFEEGTFKGHSFGNLFLTAVEKMTGDFAQGIEVAARVLDITGRVEPVTLSNVRLVMREADGSQTTGESTISEHHFDTRAAEFWLEPEAEANPKAVEAIMEADLVVIAPGNLYGSLAPALVVPGIRQALRATDATCVYVCNLVTKPGQTDGYDVGTFAQEIERLVGGAFLDVVLYNTQKPRASLLDKYAREGELAVTYDVRKLDQASYQAIGVPLLSPHVWRQRQAQADSLADARTLIRHDPQAVATAIFRLQKKS